MIRITKNIFLSLYKFKKIKSYILRINRRSKRYKVKKPLVNNDDDPYPVYLTNRRAKFTLLYSRGEFGFFCFVKKKDMHFIFFRCRGPPDFDFLNQENSKFGGKNMFNDKSPYTIRSEVINNVQHYFVSFVDGENNRRDTEVSRSVFLEIYKSIKMIRNLTRFDERHIEMSDMTEEAICNRAVHQPKNVEDVVITKKLYNELRLAISELPELQKRRFILHYEYNLTLEQIAEMEGCTKMPIKRSVDRAKEKILEKIKNI